MNTYTWQIEALDCVPSIDGQTNVVNNIHWRVNGTDGTHSGTVYGVQGLTYSAGSPFTAYDSLTEDIVIGWLKTAMGTEQVASLEQNLDNQIANLTNPPIVTLPLPWGK